MSSEPTPKRPLGGIVHSYLGYDPKRFPSPSAPTGDAMAGSAFDHLLHYGSQRPLTEAELAEAIEIDPSDSDLISELNELSAQRAITEGGFNQSREGDTGDFRKMIRDADKQAELADAEKLLRRGLHTLTLAPSPSP